ncbi:DUF1385 domain-containing protein [bacterium]|nr:DUF1385 domain-containing protein [bacterium]
MKQQKWIPVGGQAVIEGVMMRSPEAVAVAVRNPDGRIVVRRTPWVSWTERFRLLKMPIIRGAVILIESIVLGIRALGFSAEVAAQEQNSTQCKQQKSDKKGVSNLSMVLLLVIAFTVALGLFFYLPLILTESLGIKSGVWFNLTDGGFRLVVFLVYLGSICLLKDIRRIFEYHGAEHKSVFAFENQLELTVSNAKDFSTHHPRCGTSFLLIVMMVSVLVFMFLGRPETITDRLVRLFFVPLIGGISYELIRYSGKTNTNSIIAALVKPGLWLQRITTREPDESQLEVALVALKSALIKGPQKSEVTIAAEKKSNIT